MKKNKIAEYEGRATFKDSNTVDVKLNAGGEETLKFRTCIIATGTTVRLIPGSKLSKRVVTYEEQILQDHLPSSIIIAGAGAIGVEFAYILNSYGVNVTMIEFFDRIVPMEDEEVSAELNRQYRKSGIKTMTGTRVDAILETDSDVRVTVTTTEGEQRTLTADRVLQAIGFKPRTDGYGLENTGVKLTDRGAIDVNPKMQTNVPHIYAIGDVTSKLMLAHVAEAMGVIAAEHIAGVETIELDFDMMPRATFCQPQIASFGYTETQARETIGLS